MGTVVVQESRTKHDKKFYFLQSETFSSLNDSKDKKQKKKVVMNSPVNQTNFLKKKVGLPK